MNFSIGCDLEEFRRYWSLNGYTRGTLDHLEKNVFLEDLSNLIVWRENDEIVGHAVWHESSTEEHRTGDPRDEEDRRTLEKLLDGEKSFVELHEVWLMIEHRRKGFGKKFFSFFEAMIQRRGFDFVVFYADHPAAISICHQRGWKEFYIAGMDEHVFSLSLKG